MQMPQESASVASRAEPLAGGRCHIRSPEVARRLEAAYAYGLRTYDHLDKDRLAAAYREAAVLASCDIFQETLLPDICVDPAGEFTLSCEPKGGYVDIGVTGAQELSYHVRNDLDPQKSANDDLDWRDQRIPERLLHALAALAT